MEYREIISSCYCGNGPEKLEKARSLARKYGAEFRQDPEISACIAGLRAAVATLDSHMAAMEMGKICNRCAATAKGGCCSAYMGHENNDVLQLLMNILADVEVELVEDDGVGCCFLGRRGCILLFKPIFCLNYLCERIQKDSSAEVLVGLEHKTGALLGAQVALEQILISFLQQA